MRSVLFKVRRQYYEAILRGEKTWEYRKDTKRWRTVFDSDPEIAVFMCGKNVLRLPIVGKCVFPNASAAFGMPENPDHLKMLGDGEVLGFQIRSPCFCDYHGMREDCGAAHGENCGRLADCKDAHFNESL